LHLPDPDTIDAKQTKKQTPQTREYAMNICPGNEQTHPKVPRHGKDHKQKHKLRSSFCELQSCDRQSEASSISSNNHLQSISQSYNKSLCSVISISIASHQREEKRREMSKKSRATTAGPPPPPFTCHPSATLCDSISMTGTFPIYIGANSFLHPRCKLNTQEGPITIGSSCIINERSQLTAPPGANGLIIGDGVLIEVNSIVEAARVGTGCVIEVGSRLGKGCVLGCVFFNPPPPSSSLLSLFQRKR